ncbi:MAG: glycosyltransferase family 2 protein, partial [Acidimicrobiales bacterium]
MGVTAVVAARDRADSVADTVAALAGLDHVESVWVVDDGSTDATAAIAAGAGAHVVRLPRNLGKGGAVRAGVVATPEAEVYLLVDADVGRSAAGAGPLLEPVLLGDADMTVGVLPAAGGRGGFGLVREVSRTGIARACGFHARAPLSGQRAVRATLLRTLALAPRFGLETALTIDAVRAGARVVEVDVALDHLHTGRSLAGFAHRAGQGRDVVAALWPRLPTLG